MTAVRPTLAVATFLFSCLSLWSQAPRIDKLDPPNWWIQMPAPMLLVKGEHLDGGRFTVGDLPLERTVVSHNGHWAELWLGRDAATAGEVLLKVTTPQGTAQQKFRFDTRRVATDGFAGFSSRDVLYLIMTDRFADGDHRNDGPFGKDSMDSDAARVERTNPRGWHGGDLRGVIDHLDYLQTLGITTVWITPVYQNHSPDAYHGYHATDMYAVDEHFGTLDDLKALGKALHARGMKLVLDTVPNHVGPRHPWVADSPEPDWFHGTQEHHREAVMDFQPLTNPYAPWRDQKDITEGWFVNALPDNNQENPTVAKYLIQNAIWWIEEAGLDGLRIDTYSYIGRDFWHRFHAELQSLYPHLTSVGEVANPDPQVVSSFADGVTRNGVNTGLWTPLDFPLRHAIIDAFTGAGPMQELATVLRQDALYPHPERLTPFIDSHDEIRFASQPGGTLAANKLAMAFLLTVRGMPQLYSGDELYLQGYQDPDNRRDFPGGFPGSANDGFQSGGRTDEQASMFHWTSQLLALRQKTTALMTGQMQLLYTSHDSIVYLRSTGEQHVLIAIHRGTEDTTLHFETALTGLAGMHSNKLIFGDGKVTLDESGAALKLPANGVLMAQVEP